MNLFDSSIKILTSVVNDKIDFSQAIRINSTGILNNERRNVISLCGITLRNYFLVEHFTKTVLKLTETSDVITIGVLFANLAFRHYIKEEETMKCLNDYFTSKSLTLTEENIKAFKDLVIFKKNYFFKDVIRGSLEFFSIKFNFPLWFLRMILKQYDRENMVNICRECSKMPQQYAIRNIFTEIPENLKNLLSSFSEMGNNVYKYNPTTSIKMNDLIHQQHLFATQFAPTTIANILPELNEEEVLIYIGERTYDFLSVFYKYFSKNTVNVIYKKNSSMFDICSKFRNYGLPKISFNEANEDSCLAYLSKEQSVVCYFPKSSSFDLIRRIPDYAVTFDPTTLDALIEDELAGLEALSKHVAPNGVLVYAVNTIDIKETVVLIYKFLEKHRDFKEEKSLSSFPYDKDNSLYYYSVLRRNK